MTRMKSPVWFGRLTRKEKVSDEQQTHQPPGRIPSDGVFRGVCTADKLCSQQSNITVISNLARRAGCAAPQALERRFLSLTLALQHFKLPGQIGVAIFQIRAKTEVLIPCKH